MKSLKFIIWVSIRAFRFALFLFRVSGYDHVKKLPKEERNLRILTCFNCPGKKFDSGMLECTQCKCNVILKSEWKEEECPLGYWKNLSLQSFLKLLLVKNTGDTTSGN